MYTINGKECTEFDINVRCAELMFSFHEIARDRNGAYVVTEKSRDYNPCKNASDTWPIIEKCWDKLNLKYRTSVTAISKDEDVCKALFNNLIKTKWELLIEQHNCTKLVAACICLIEMSEGE